MAAASLPLALPTWCAHSARSAISAWISRSIPSIWVRTAARSGVACLANSLRLRVEASAAAGLRAAGDAAAALRPAFGAFGCLAFAAAPGSFAPFLFVAGFARHRVLRSAMTLLELPHVIDQCLHARHRHRVVERCAHAAQHAVALEADQAGLACAIEERAV